LGHWRAGMGCRAGGPGTGRRKTGSAMPAASATMRSLARPRRPPARKC